MTTFVVPTSVTHPDGTVYPLPGHVDYIPGTDVTDPLQFWLSGGVTTGPDSDGYTPWSGADADNVNTIQFRTETYPIKYGILIGAFQNRAAATDASGRVWPQVISHAWKHTIFDLNGATLQDPDPTVTDTNVLSRTADIDITTTTVSGITPPLSPTEVAELRAGIGGTTSTARSQVQSTLLGRTVTGASVTSGSPTVTASGGAFKDSDVGRFVSGTGIPASTKIVTIVSTTQVTLSKNATASGTITVTLASNQLFRSSIGYAAPIASVSDDGTTVTHSGTTLLTAADVSVQFNAPDIEPRRAGGFNLISFGSPGFLNAERDCLTTNIVFRNGTIQGSNPLAQNSVYTDRENWHALVFRLCDGVTVEDCTIRDVWGDGINTGAVNQLGQSTAQVSLQAENVTVQRCLFNIMMRHAITDQGSLFLTVDRCVFARIGHWGYDSEPGSPSCRMLGATITNSAFDCGYSLYTAHPLGFFAEPPRTVPDVTQGTASNLLTVPYDMVDADDQGATITGTGIPAGTWITRRLDPTTIEVSQAVTVSGTITITISAAPLFRNTVWDTIGVVGSNPGFQGSTGARRSRVYFGADSTISTPTLSSLEFDTRDDGLTFTEADIGRNVVGTISGTTTLTLTSGTFTSDDTGRYAINATHCPAGTTLTYVSPTVATLSQACTNGSGLTVGIVTSSGASTKSVTARAGGVVVKAGVPVGYDTTAHTVTMPTNALKTVTSGTTATVSVIANRRTMTATVNTFAASDVGRTVTGTGIRDGTYIAGFDDAKHVRISQPASSSATTTVTFGSPRFYASLGPGVWDGLTIRRVRNCGTAAFAGSLPEPVTGQTLFTIPTFETGVIVDRTFGAAATLGNQSTTTMSVADVATLNGTTDLTILLAQGVFNTSGGYFEATTSGGTATFSYTGIGITPAQRVKNVTLIRGSGSLSNGATVTSIGYRMVGQYQEAGNCVPGFYGFTVTNNRWPHSIDNQVADPTVTVDLTLTADDLNLTRPTFTVTATRSDAGSLDGETVTVLRNGVIRAMGILDGDTAVIPMLNDQPTGQPWTAQWAGSWDTLGSNEVVTPPPPSTTPTTTVLTASPTSPSDEGTTVTLTATVSPTPDGGNVVFREATTILGTVALIAGVATLDVTFTAGTHPLVGSYVGDALYAASFGDLTYTADVVVPEDSTRPDVLTVDPADGDRDVARLPTITVTFTESVTDPIVELRDEHDNLLPGTVDGSGAVWTFVPNRVLHAGRTFAFSVRDAVDLAGNHLLGPEVFRFSTVDLTASQFYPVLIRS